MKRRYKIGAALAGAALAVPVAMSSPALATDIAQDYYTFGCTGTKAGAWTMSYHGHVDVSLTEEVNGTTANKSYFYNGGDNSYQVVTFAANYRIQSSTTIGGLATTSGQSANILNGSYSVHCVDVP